MVRFAFHLNRVTTTFCLGFFRTLLEHPVFFILLIPVIWIAISFCLDNFKNSKISKLCISFLISTIALVPANCVVQGAARAIYGEEVKNEFIRIDGSASYLDGRAAATSAYTKASEYLARENTLRESGLCNTKRVSFERQYSQLVCADGWTGSSCGCGGGRGCCSHHGGYGYCDSRVTVEERMLIDGMLFYSREGLDRLDECGGSRTQLLIEYDKKKWTAASNELSVSQMNGANEWLLGWHDVSSKISDFNDVVKKDSLFSP